MPQIFPQRVETQWQLRSRSLPLGKRTLVMGVVNITPDSFSDGGLYAKTEPAIEHALRLLDEGADILDLGAESTRPGSRAGSQSGDTPAVSAEEEQDRLLPVIEGVVKLRPDATLSVDTYKAATARAAVAAGAEIINDVSGFTWDAAMASTCADLHCGVVLMHTRGLPEEWRGQPPIEPNLVLPVVHDGLVDRLKTALAAGIVRQALVLDPGYGFGKRFEENYELLAGQADLLSLGFPLLVGLSRKSFLGRTLASHYGSSSALVSGRETASVAAQTAAILLGASIIRVHAVRAGVEAACIADAVSAAARVG